MESVSIPQWALNLVSFVATGVGGWFLRALWEAQRKLNEDMKSIQIDLAKNYVTTDMFERKMDKLFEKLDRIEDKLDRKVDKIGLIPPSGL